MWRDRRLQKGSGRMSFRPEGENGDPSVGWGLKRSEEICVPTKGRDLKARSLASLEMTRLEVIEVTWLTGSGGLRWVISQIVHLRMAAWGLS